MSESAPGPENEAVDAGAAPRPAPASAGVPRLRIIQADELFENEREVLIQHGNQVYRLRRTRSGKLLLCK